MPTQLHGTETLSDRAAGRQRQKVLGILRDAEGPVDAQCVADALRIHITTARFHLTTLEDQGAIRRGGAKGGRAGRPRLTYEPAPRLDYAEVVSLFAVHLGGTAAEREERAVRIGADLAHRVGVARRRDNQSIVDLVVATLADLGFQTRSVLTSFGQTVVQICTCPLATVALTAPEVVRDIQQGLIQEVIDHNRDLLGDYRVTVSPDPHGGSCEVALVLQPVPHRG